MAKAAYVRFWERLSPSQQESFKKNVQERYNTLAGRKATTITDAEWNEILDVTYTQLEKMGYANNEGITDKGVEAGLANSTGWGSSFRKSKSDKELGISDVNLTKILDSVQKGDTLTNLDRILTRKDVGGTYLNGTSDIQNNILETQTADQELKKFLDINRPEGVSDEEWATRTKDLTSKFWDEYNSNLNYNASDVTAKLSKDFSQALETPEETQARLEMEDANKDLTGTTTDAGTPIEDFNGDRKINSLDRTLASAADKEKAARAELATSLETGRQGALSEALSGIDQARAKIPEYENKLTQALQEEIDRTRSDRARIYNEGLVSSRTMRSGAGEYGWAKSEADLLGQAKLQGAQYGLDLQSQLDQARVNAQGQYASLGAQNAAMVGQYGYDEGMNLQNVLVQDYLNKFGYGAQIAAMNQTQRYNLLNQNIQNSYNTTARATDFQNQMSMLQQQFEYNKQLANMNKQQYSGLGSAIGSLMGGTGSLLSGFGSLGIFSNQSKTTNPFA